MAQSPDLAVLAALEAHVYEWIDLGDTFILRVIDERDGSTVAFKGPTQSEAFEGVIAQLRQRREAQDRETPPEEPA